MVANLVPFKNRSLTLAQFGDLAEVPPELEWLANITNVKTRRAYRNGVEEFSAFTGLRQPAELRGIIRAHVIVWRKHLESRALAHALEGALGRGVEQLAGLGVTERRRELPSLPLATAA